MASNLKVAIYLTAFGAAITAISAAMYFVWPSPWRYDHIVVGDTTLPVRTHRLHGTAEIFQGAAGWVVATNNSEPKPTKASSPLSESELKKLDGTLRITDYGWMTLDLHNGTSRELDEVEIQLLVFGKTTSTRLDRSYRLSARGARPLTAVRLEDRCGCQIEKGQDFTWLIVSATAK